MPKSAPRFLCSACGASTTRWAGKCDACGSWNTIEEEPVQTLSGPKQAVSGKAKGVEFVGLQGDAPDAPRLPTGIGEFDRVCGGGLVPGSALLVGGDPGIGKSTLLLQAAARVAAQGVPALYLTGEESVAQVRLRAERLGVAEAPVRLASATSLSEIVSGLEKARAKAPGLVIIDSIQTLWSDALESAPGTVSQVRLCTHELIARAKQAGYTLVLVGHVTKEGQIAGPRVVEHMVDTVLYFEGDTAHQFRILRGIKNRFGATDEIGVFAMTGDGLEEVENPSALFLDERARDVPGSAVFAGMEGTRPMLVEIQALVAPATYGTPRRAVLGWDTGRLAMVLAVLETRCGLALGANDIHLNVAAGLKIREPAADLAVAAALISAQLGVPLPPDAVVFGEIALSGDVRPVALAEQRLKEAAKLGFTRAFLPARHIKGADTSGKGKVSAPSGLKPTAVNGLPGFTDYLRRLAA